MYNNKTAAAEQDHLWPDVQRVVDQQNEKMSRGWSFEQGEDRIVPATAGIGLDTFVLLNAGSFLSR